MAKTDTKKGSDDSKTAYDLILKLLDKTRPVRNKDLVAAVTKGGFSIPTASRHLKRLRKSGDITVIRHKDFLHYGIESKDKKAAYYMTKSATEQARYYDAVITALPSEKPEERRRALVEIEGMGKITLLPYQLFNISKALINADEKEAYAVTRILLTHGQKDIFPSDTAKFQDYLIEGYKRFRHLSLANGEHSNLRGNILAFLAHYKNPIVFEFLKEDLQTGKDLEHLYSIYSSEQFYEMINDHPAVLFNLGKGLDEKQEMTLRTIRATCKMGVEHKKQLKKGKGGSIYL